MSAYAHGLSTTAHDKMNVGGYYHIVYEKVAALQEKALIVDVFSGGGRDIEAFYKLRHGNGRYVAIDNDPPRIEDMLKKGFVLAQTQEDIETTFVNAKIAVVRGTFPQHAYGDGNINLDGRADFILCNAGLMFVKPEQRDATLKQFASMLARAGEMILRFSGERKDVEAKLGKTYFIHDVAAVENTLRREGLDVIRSADLLDPSPGPERPPFYWTDLHVSRHNTL